MRVYCLTHLVTQFPAYFGQNWNNLSLTPVRALTSLLTSLFPLTSRDPSSSKILNLCELYKALSAGRVHPSPGK